MQPEGEEGEIANDRQLLIVDDEKLVRESLAGVFKREGYSVTSAANGVLAMEVIGHQKPDVVVSDIMMPEMDGIDFLLAVRQHDLDVPVIFLTGSPSSDTAARAVDAGAFRYLSKPPDLDYLKESVSTACRLHDLARAKRFALGVLGTTEKAFGDRAGTEATYRRGQNALSVALQPIVDVRGNEVVGYEALLRTREPMIPGPEVFLCMAERLGRTRELGKAVRDAVAKELGSLHPSATVFVNLHANDLEDEALLAEEEPLTQVANRVVLEVSDQTPLCDRITALTDRVRALKERGFRVALDHVGAGLAGVANVAALEPGFAKIDVALVAEVADTEEKQRAIRELSSVNGELGIDTIAVGVERAADRDALALLGCPLQQGFLFGRPT